MTTHIFTIPQPLDTEEYHALLRALVLAEEEFDGELAVSDCWQVVAVTSAAAEAVRSIVEKGDRSE